MPPDRMDIAKIGNEARFFRQAIEWYQKEYPNEVLVSDPLRLNSKFPHDCCKSASWMLGHYLSSKGFNNIRYIWGYRDGSSHGWLQVDDIIVDITADQFKDEGRPVIVAQAENSEFHSAISDHQDFAWEPSRYHGDKAENIVTEFEERAA